MDQLQSSPENQSGFSFFQYMPPLISQSMNQSIVYFTTFYLTLTLTQNPDNKQWSIVGNPEFNKANETLNAVCKDMVKRGQVSPVVHEAPITSEQLQKFYESQQLDEAITTNPTQLLRTAWFYVTLYFGKRCRESQRKLEKQMLCLRQIPEGRQYYELRAVLSTKNRQGGLHDSADESDGKMFELKGSPRCPVQTVDNYLGHLHPELSCLFQRPRAISAKFDPRKDDVWFCNTPIGQSMLSSMMKTMSQKAGIEPHLTNHCFVLFCLCKSYCCDCFV